MNINSNTFYRINNAALGALFSLDIADQEGGNPSGLVTIAPSRLSSGQFWQFFSSDHPGQGPYYLSNLFLGPQKTLDGSLSNGTTWVPYVNNLTTARDQTWTVTTHNESSIGTNSTRYSLVPQFFGGSKALSLKNDTRQPVLGDIGGDNQLWELKPVMQINDAGFPTSALWAMQTPTTAATSTSSVKQTALPSLASSPATAEPTESYNFPKSALILTGAATITLVIAVIMLGSMFLIWRWMAYQQKPAAFIDQKLGNPCMPDSSTEMIYRPRTSLPKAGTRIYTPSIASSGEFDRSTPADFSPLNPRPPSRSISWIQERYDQAFFDASTLRSTSKDGEGNRPISPILPVKLAAGSPRASVAEIEGGAFNTSRRSALDLVRGNEMDRTTKSLSSGSVRRQLSLISRWKL